MRTITENPLAGGSFRNWLRLVRDNGGIDAKYFPRAVYVTAMTFALFPLRLAQRVLYARKIRAERLSAAGIIPWVNFMAGFPDETGRDLDRTIGAIGRLVERVPRAMVAPLYAYAPYPGTRLYERSVEKGFQPAKALSGLARSTWRKPDTPWLSAGRRALLEKLYFYTLFVDNKVTYYRPGLLALVLLALMRPVARWRIRKRRFGMPIEKRLFEAVLGNEY